MQIIQSSLFRVVIWERIRIFCYAMIPVVRVANIEGIPPAPTVPMLVGDCFKMFIMNA